MNLSLPSARAEAVTRRTYNRPLDDDGTVLETWEQTANRATRIHHHRLWESAGGEPDSEELDELYTLVHERKALVSGRTLWLGGTDYSASRACSQFNCSYTRGQTVYELVDIFWLLLNGCGVGFRPIAGTLHGFLKPIPELSIIESNQPPDHHGDPHNQVTPPTPDNGHQWIIKIGDSAEAWAKSLGKLLNPPTCAVRKLTLDFSDVRGPGKRLKGYGWICNGSKPLQRAYIAIFKIMNAKAGDLLDEIDLLDVINWLGTVLSSRRSAQIAVMDYDHPRWEQFARAKNQWWLHDAEHRQQSNNSLVFWHKPTKREIHDIMQMIWDCGGSEPGFINGTAARNRAPWFDGLNPSLRAGTKVLARIGVVPIEQLEGQTFETPNLDGAWSDAECFLSGRNKPLYLITLATGHELYATAEHKWPVYLNGRYVKIETQNLTSGDEFPLNERDDLPSGTYGTYEEGFAVGYLLGNGSVTQLDGGREQYGVTCPTGDVDCQAAMLEFFTACGTTVNFRPSSNGGDSVETSSSAVGVQSKLHELDFEKGRLPRWCWAGGTEAFRRGVVDGLFSSDGDIDTDGVIPRIKIGSQSCERLVRETSELLGFYGIRSHVNSRVHTSRTPNGNVYTGIAWTVRINGTLGVKHFWHVFGPLTCGRKSYPLEEFYTVETPRSRDVNRVKVASVELTDLCEDVWDVTVHDQTHCFTLASCITGNCGEILLQSRGFCNLVTTAVSKFNDNFAALLRALYVMGRANYRQTCVELADGVLMPEWHQTNSALRLCGMSLTGISQAPWLTDYQIRQMRNTAIAGAYSMADELGLPKPKLVTTIKPEGCRPVDELTITDEGILSYREMLADHPLGQDWCNPVTPINVTRPGESVPVSRTFYNGVAPVIEIAMTYGMVVRSTVQHPWFVDEIGTVRGNRWSYAPYNDWVEASDLKVGMVLNVVPGLYRKQTEAPLKPVLLTVKDAGAIPLPTLPTQTSPDLCWLLGVFWGDGSGSSAKLSKTKFFDDTMNEGLNLDRVSRVLHEQFGLETTYYHPSASRDDVNVIEFASKHLYRWLQGNGIDKYATDPEGVHTYRSNGRRQLNPHVPEVVRRASRESILAFLAGVLDTDGCVHLTKKNTLTVSWTSANSEFLRSVQTLAWACGLRIGHSLNDGGRNHQKTKQMFLATLAYDSDLEAWELLAHHSGKIQRVLGQSPTVRVPAAASLRPDVTKPGKIKSIKLLDPVPTADIEVPGDHYYYAGCGVKSHNTGSKIMDVTEGIHKPLGRHIFNWIIFPSNDPIVGIMLDAGYRVIDHPHDPLSKLICFPVDYSGCRFDMHGKKPVNMDTAVEQLEVYRRWNTLWTDHNSSITISWDIRELDEIVEWLYRYWNDFVAVSWLMRNDPTKTAKDLGYAYLPQEVVTIDDYEAYTKGLQTIDWTKLHGIHDLSMTDCAGGVCPVK